MTKEAQKYYERMYGKPWEKFTEAEKAQFERVERDKLPIKGDKILKKEKSIYHVFPKK